MPFVFIWKIDVSAYSIEPVGEIEYGVVDRFKEYERLSDELLITPKG